MQKKGAAESTCAKGLQVLYFESANILSNHFNTALLKILVSEVAKILLPRLLVMNAIDLVIDD